MERRASRARPASLDTEETQGRKEPLARFENQPTLLTGGRCEAIVRIESPNRTITVIGVIGFQSLLFPVVKVAGPVGPRGAPGAPGAPGKPGEDGRDGRNGENGAEGEQVGYSRLLHILTVPTTRQSS